MGEKSIRVRPLRGVPGPPVFWNHTFETLFPIREEIHTYRPDAVALLLLFASVMEAEIVVPEWHNQPICA